MESLETCHVPVICDKKYLHELEEGRLAVYAMKSRHAERRHPIPSEGRRHDYRTEFQRDRDRIVHSRAFRRLKHKTQVFVATEGDHQRTRLTHTLEVSQVARTLCRALSLNEDLAEAIALGHDLGHTPFGHIGESVLHGIMSGRDDLDGLLDFDSSGRCDGFKHNFQSLRVVDLLEKRYDNEGLNLSDETRFGILKHTSLPAGITYQPFESEKFTVDSPLFLEAQVVAISDEIAQQAHDMEDGLRAGLVDLSKMERLDLVVEVIRNIAADYQASRRSFHKQNMLVRGTIHFLVTDILLQTGKNIRRWVKEEGVHRTEDFYERLSEIPSGLISFSPKGKRLFLGLKDFVYREIINSYEVNRMDGRAIHFLRALFKAYFVNPRQLQDWALFRYAHGRKETYLRDIPLNEVGRKIEALQKEPAFLRLVCDHIAGMSDRFAMEEYRKLYLPNMQG
jgi:dGTPase